MRTVILAGGFGTRLSEKTQDIPKPMVEVGGRPLLWHIMQSYGRFGFKEFVLALGYKQWVVKQYFMQANLMNRDFSVDLSTGAIKGHRNEAQDWLIHMFDTGLETMTGGRIGRLADWLSQGTFMLTYGDGLSDVDIPALLACHRRQGRLATITAVRPPARFGGIVFNGEAVAAFTEKPQIGEGWINGGFMVLEPGVLDYIDGDATVLEKHVLERLAADGELAAYQHPGFWQCCDTLRDLRTLQDIWDQGSPPWLGEPASHWRQAAAGA
jgi:glucose-1-phosphate cytidylyltransferase